jgi:hypothetical protein
VSSWKIAGQPSDLTKTIEMLVKELLESQWSETYPTAADIMFGTGWGAGLVKNFAIHCLHVSTTSELAVNGWSTYQYRTSVDVHVFARRTTRSESDELIKMRQHIDRIVAQNKTSLGRGVSLVRLVQWTTAHDPADLSKISYWHLVGQHEAMYYKMNTA